MYFTNKNMSHKEELSSPTTNFHARSSSTSDIRKVANTCVVGLTRFMKSLIDGVHARNVLIIADQPLPPNPLLPFSCHLQPAVNLK
jgi:hypothetical protein